MMLGVHDRGSGLTDEVNRSELKQNLSIQHSQLVVV
jgi:hypothetical protein